MIPLDPIEQAERRRSSAWILPYTAYAASIHEGHPLHHEMVAFTLLSVMAGPGWRLRHFGGGDITGNLWCMLVGGPGNLKSETIRLGERLGGARLRTYRYADDFSPEKIINDLATRDTRNLIFIQDEASYLFDQMKKDFMGSTAQLLCKIYDGRILQQSRQGKETVTAEDYHASFLGGIQPDAFEASMKEASLRRGLLSRYLWIPAPQEMPTGKRVQWDRTEENKLENALALIQECAGTCELRLSDEADETFQEYVQAHHRWAAKQTPDLATLGVRYRALPLKLALLLHLDRAVAQEPVPINGSAVIGVDTLREAITYALRWRKLLPQVFADFAPTSYSKHYKRVHRWIESHQPHAPHSDLLRGVAQSGIRARDIADVITSLRDAKMIVSTAKCPNTNGTCYHLDADYAAEEAAKNEHP